MNAPATGPSRTLLVICIMLLASACGSPAPVEAGPAATPAPAAAAQPAATAPVAASTPARVQSVEKSALEAPCFLSEAEATSIAGVQVGPGKPNTNLLASDGMASCRYEGQGNTLVVNLTWIDPARLAAWKAYFDQPLAGQMVALPGDPDGAKIQVQEGIGGALHYIRQNVQVEVRPMTWTGTPAETWTDRLKSARRFP